jgi:hypothetical protein
MNARRALALLLIVAAAGVIAFAAGEVWRYPVKDAPATGPSLVEIGTPGREAAPKLTVLVRDDDGKPVPGMAVNVFAYMGTGKKKSKTPEEPKLNAAATGPDGTLTIRGLDTKDLAALRVAFIWDGGVKAVRARLEPTKGVWGIAGAAYKRVDDGKDEGSCKNLFTMKTGAAGSDMLEFSRPPSIAWCEDVVYGSKKHERELVRVNAIAARNVNKSDKNMYKPDDEIKMGLEASAQFDQKMPGIKDAQIVGYVTNLAKKVVAASDKPDSPVNVRVIHTNDVNAFVTAGGHIYVFTGLIKMAQNESQLAGVLAHEISHAIARHVTEGATRNQLAQGGAQIGSAVLGGLLGLGENTQALLDKGATTGTGLITLKYDRGSETEADLLGSQYLWKGGWDPEAIANFFALFAKMKKGSGTPAFLSTHPSDDKRIQNGITWARTFLPPKDKYLVDTAEFQACKAKVAKLPAPPPTQQPAAGASGSSGR